LRAATDAVEQGDVGRGPRDNFLTAIIDADIASNEHGGQVVTRFPPEPNGYLHIGHAKSICLNFGLGQRYGGRTHLRFDDTNPVAEDVEYVESIQDDVRWLGFQWHEALFFASDFFEQMCQYAVDLIRVGKAYVDSQSKEAIREQRGSFETAGRDSPWRDRPIEESLDLFARMRAGEFDEGSHVLRARIDMAHPNMLMRDPLLYRIRKVTHHRTGDTWCIYPMYDFAHCLEDAFEGVTHSICTLEFESNRELYDWVLDARGDWQPRPRQYEFARLSLGYTVMSKRKLLQLVELGRVSGWDDPRMPTLAGMRRRGVTAEAIRRFCEMIGVSKNNSIVDIGKLEYCIRADLEQHAPRAMGVLRPLKVVLSNYPQGQTEQLEAPWWPGDPDRAGSRNLPFDRELYIERTDFSDEPPKDWHRLALGREVRLRNAYFIRCDSLVRDEQSGEITELHCTYDPQTKGGKSADGRKVKGTIHWLSASGSAAVEVRLYDRLFGTELPDADPEVDFKDHINPDSLLVCDNARVEPAVADASSGQRFQFERVGYFVVDTVDSAPGAPVFNRIIGLRDSWAKVAGKGRLTGRPDRSSAGEETKGPSPVKTDSRPTRADYRAERRAANTELSERYDRYQRDLGLSANDSDLITSDLALVTFFEAALVRHGDAASVAKWLCNEVLRLLKDRSVGDLPFDGGAFGELVALVDGGKITTSSGKTVLERMAATGRSPGRIVDELGLKSIGDDATLQAAVTQVLAIFPDEVARYRDGEPKLLGFFMGQVMRKTAGKGDAQRVRQILADQL
jgi:glutaminyl-tRNA synthetase